ncbi:hypothetical protein Sgleb_24060 [Streptomyces glebosus]|uniref:Uncharacterized protein n=1 Tax=Streptomyces glebosus TaxID=249580 RepID=A0A640SSC7_9ACTN|nr:hypothetical protein Sgleb_24060 [Streptomyces glebosus]GHG55054.1 hypothetical protein GCM10010513_16890 [Streptomyces glebosus]
MPRRLGSSGNGGGVSAGRAAAALAIAVMPGNVASSGRYFRYVRCDVRGVRARHPEGGGEAGGMQGQGRGRSGGKQGSL